MIKYQPFLHSVFRMEVSQCASFQFYVLKFCCFQIAHLQRFRACSFGGKIDISQRWLCKTPACRLLPGVYAGCPTPSPCLFSNIAVSRSLLHRMVNNYYLFLLAHCFFQESSTQDCQNQFLVWSRKTMSCNSLFVCILCVYPENLNVLDYISKTFCYPLLS